MVRLEEVEDEEFVQAGNKEFDDDDDFTDTDSEISDDDDTQTPSESLGDRLFALRDMIPPTTRRKLASNFSTATGYTKSGLRFGGKAFWVVSTSILFFGIPMALSVVEEMSILEMEKEQKVRDMGNEILTPGVANSGTGEQQAKAAL